MLHLSTGRELMAWQRTPLSGTPLAFATDDDRVVLTLDTRLFLWDFAAHRVVLTLEGHPGGVHSVSFTPNRVRIVSTCWRGDTRVWEAATGREVLVLHHPENEVAALSPDGRRFAVGCRDGTVLLYDTADWTA
jgi:WD40 repeat protein